MFGNRTIWAEGWKAVTLHVNRLPWDLNVVLPFDKDKWELYNVDEDFSESTDLAAKYPEKLEELKKNQALKRGYNEMKKWYKERYEIVIEDMPKQSGMAKAMRSDRELS